MEGFLSTLNDSHSNAAAHLFDTKVPGIWYLVLGSEHFCPSTRYQIQRTSSACVPQTGCNAIDGQEEGAVEDGIILIVEP